MATYYASKAFVLSFTEAMAGELRGTGVTATASCPGPTSTEFGEVAGSSKSNLFKRHVADAASVARHGYRAMLAGTVVAIPGLQNKLSVQSVRIAPRARSPRHFRQTQQRSLKMTDWTDTFLSAR